MQLLSKNVFCYLRCSGEINIFGTQTHMHVISCMREMQDMDAGYDIKNVLRQKQNSY